ncbi:hypothetical protein BD289DRAFT_435550 [Coniella lustricola]|uniref:Uncharacterized protein n=1 Tax=Coniella lustricola TaxID=2025994 RepID=A0A2T3A6C9_9PEZI|nr:hypothetical protein BD289DRAFT_435550 [Coniella lustricola]
MYKFKFRPNSVGPGNRHVSEFGLSTPVPGTPPPPWLLRFQERFLWFCFSLCVAFWYSDESESHHVELSRGVCTCGLCLQNGSVGIQGVFAGLLGYPVHCIIIQHVVSTITGKTLGLSFSTEEQFIIIIVLIIVVVIVILIFIIFSPQAARLHDGFAPVFPPIYPGKV